MKAYTLRDLIADAQEYLAVHPEDAELQIYVPYDSDMALTTVYGGFERREHKETGEVELVLGGDS